MSGPRALDIVADVSRPAHAVGFDWSPRTRVVFGNGKIDDLGSLAASLGARRTLVVTDPGIVAAGHAGRGMQSLTDSGIEALLFEGVGENPTTVHVEAATAVARSFRPDLIVGLGGGSAMDCAKGTNFIYSRGGRMQDYWGVDKTSGPMLPMIGVPTTAGTGSELQSFALISDPVTHIKMACGDRQAACAIAILDPELTLTQPPLVTALTGIDALSHALETWVTRPRNPISLMASRQAWELVSKNLPRVMEEPSDLEARSAMLLGAALAGMAIENSMLGAAHALANPLTARFNLAHGHAVGLMLPPVIRFNADGFGDWYADLAGPEFSGDDGSPASGIGAFVSRMLQEAGLPRSLRECGVPREAIPDLATLATAQWTGRFNPREVNLGTLAELYERAW